MPIMFCFPFLFQRQQRGRTVRAKGSHGDVRMAKTHESSCSFKGSAAIAKQCKELEVKIEFSLPGEGVEGGTSPRTMTFNCGIFVQHNHASRCRFMFLSKIKQQHTRFHDAISSLP